MQSIEGLREVQRPLSDASGTGEPVVPWKKSVKNSYPFRSLRSSFMHFIEGHHQVFRGVKIFAGAVLDGIAGRTRRSVPRHRLLAYNFEFHWNYAGTYHADRARGAEGKVDDATLDERPTIVDPHLHFLPIHLILHTHDCIERQRSMRCGHRLIRIEDLTVGRSSTVIRLGIIRREAF